MKTKIILTLLVSSMSASALVYCPSEVICEETGNIDSCQFEQDGWGYWGSLSDTGYPSAVVPGIYTASYVSASDNSTDPAFAICVYTKVTVAGYQMLTLRATPEAQLDRYDGAGNHWRSEESWWECKPSPLEACPLQER